MESSAGVSPSRWPLGWLPWTTFVLCVLGLVDAGYQVYTHFTGTGLLGCSAKTDACVLVQNSVYAWVFGIPVAVYGAAFFAFMVVICSPSAWRSGLRLVRQTRIAAVVIGMIFVLYLMYRELVSLGHICEYCTSVHVITFLLFGLLVYDATGPRAAIRTASASQLGQSARLRAGIANQQPKAFRPGQILNRPGVKAKTGPGPRPRAHQRECRTRRAYTLGRRCVPGAGRPRISSSLSRRESVAAYEPDPVRIG
jgi:uncharacterized membrane protein